MARAPRPSHEDRPASRRVGALVALWPFLRPYKLMMAAALFALVQYIFQAQADISSRDLVRAPKKTLSFFRNAYAAYRLDCLNAVEGTWYEILVLAQRLTWLQYKIRRHSHVGHSPEHSIPELFIPPSHDSCSSRLVSSPFAGWPPSHSPRIRSSLTLRTSFAKNFFAGKW